VKGPGKRGKKHTDEHNFSPSPRGTEGPNYVSWKKRFEQGRTSFAAKEKKKEKREVPNSPTREGLKKKGKSWKKKWECLANAGTKENRPG